MTSIAPRIRRAFTMVELLVAMVITIGILLFLNEVFANVQQGVGIGMGLSSVVENVRTIDEEIARDAKLMIPPKGGGFLIIIPQDVTINGVAVAADRVAWVRSRSGDEPMCPSATTTFAAASDNGAEYIRAYYGHALIGGALPADNAAWTLIRHALYLNGAGGASTVGGGSIATGSVDVLNGTSLATLNTSGVTAASAYVDPRIGAELKTTNSFTSLEIAKMHSVLAANVAEFRVDYVADNGSGQPSVTANKLNWTRSAKTWTKSSTDWPHLIRIRYRVTDKQSRIAGSDGLPGRVFEQIIKIPR